MRWERITVGFLPRLRRNNKMRCSYTRLFLLVIGESPQEAAQRIADPEDSLYQHWSEVFLAHPVVLSYQERWECYSTQPETHLACNGVEDKRVVVGPTTIAALLWDFLNEAYYGPSYSGKFVRVILLVLQVGEELRGEGLELCASVLGVDHQAFARTGFCWIPLLNIFKILPWVSL